MPTATAQISTLADARRAISVFCETLAAEMPATRTQGSMTSFLMESACAAFAPVSRTESLVGLATRVGFEGVTAEMIREDERGCREAIVTGLINTSVNLAELTARFARGSHRKGATNMISARTESRRADSRARSAAGLA